MAFFSRKPKTEPEKSGEKNFVPPRTTYATNKDLSHVLKRPRITEKATLVGERGVYVFDVDGRATKRDISEAVAKYYKVQPRMIRVVSIPEKSVRNSRTGARGTKQGGKKAYVSLKKGETITIA